MIHTYRVKSIRIAMSVVLDGLEPVNVFIEQLHLILVNLQKIANRVSAWGFFFVGDVKRNARVCYD